MGDKVPELVGAGMRSQKRKGPVGCGALPAQCVTYRRSVIEAGDEHESSIVSATQPRSLQLLKKRDVRR